MRQMLVPLLAEQSGWFAARCVAVVGVGGAVGQSADAGEAAVDCTVAALGLVGCLVYSEIKE